MYPRKTIEKAKLINLETGKEIMEFQFNPEKLTINRGGGYEAVSDKEMPHTDWAGLKWSGAKVDELSVDFILDTTEPDLMDSRNLLSMMLPIIDNISPTMPVSKALPSLPINSDSVKSTIDDLFAHTRLIETGKSAPKDKLRPPLVKFMWGEIEFYGGISDLSFTYELFDSDGTPKRASGTIKLGGRYGGEPKEYQNLLDSLGTSEASSKQKIG
jgi:hypothetical protein